MIIGVNIDSIDANKKAATQGNVQVNYQPEIKNVEEATVNAFDEKVARIEFEFGVVYNSNNQEAARIDMGGNVIWKGGLEEILEQWEEDESLPEEMEVQLMNELYRKLLSEAVGVANTLNLLPPIPTPKVEKPQ
ncbi:MAG: hypothetical protein ACI977_000101 [Candidatus Nanohaloarchaea archaeon]|jgi:hypothetical protein